MNYRVSAARVQSGLRGSLTHGGLFPEGARGEEDVSLTPVSNALNARTAHSRFAVPTDLLARFGSFQTFH